MSAPEIAILLVTDSFAAIEKTLRHYATGVDTRRLELVIAAVAGAALDPSMCTAAGFPHVRVVDGGDGALNAAEARALRAATAPVVVFAQAHAYPGPAYADAICAARASEPWTVIGPAMVNANPESPWSRAYMWIGYGRWMGRRTREPLADVPGHNSAYDRSALVALGDEIDDLLEAGWELQTTLRARGGRLLLEPAASMAIVNPSRFGRFAVALFRQGRLVAAQRSRRWSRTRRLAYAAGSPLLPLLRLARTLGDGFGRRHDHARWRLVPAVALGLVANAAGELTGYLRGAGAPARFVRKSA